MSPTDNKIIAINNFLNTIYCCLKKKLTFFVYHQQVQQAKLEALAAFGNCTFDSLVVKKESFKSKLNSTAKTAATRKENVKRLTR